MINGYSKDCRSVTLTMTQDDYNTLLWALGYATGGAESIYRDTLLGLVNRLNIGNPNFQPYATES